MRGEMTYEFRLSADKKFKQYICVCVCVCECVCVGRVAQSV